MGLTWPELGSLLYAWSPVLYSGPPRDREMRVYLPLWPVRRSFTDAEQVAGCGHLLEKSRLSRRAG